MGSGADRVIDDATPEEWDALGYVPELKSNRVKITSDGSSANYYKLPRNVSELQDLISHRNMNAQLGEIFRECYRYGLASHSDEMRGIKKIIFYANAELKRLQGLSDV
jgi:hypothetical protein